MTLVQFGRSVLTTDDVWFSAVLRGALLFTWPVNGSGDFACGGGAIVDNCRQSGRVYEREMVECGEYSCWFDCDRGVLSGCVWNDFDRTWSEED